MHLTPSAVCLPGQTDRLERKANILTLVQSRLYFFPHYDSFFFLGLFSDYPTPSQRGQHFPKSWTTFSETVQVTPRAIRDDASYFLRT